MRLRRCIPAALAVLLLGSTAALAHLRLTIGGQTLFWQTPSNIQVVIQANGSDDLPDGSHLPALRNSIADWNAVPGTTAQLVENTSPAQMARSDWNSSSIHLLLFDENNSSGWFTGAPSIVAVTPVSFNGGGRITDADVIFNGRDHQFTTSGAPGRFDVHGVASHELGHLLGLDHSGWTGSSLFPYVSPGIDLNRSPSVDDGNGLRQAYPAQAFGSITGTVKRLSDDSPVAGAHVTCFDAVTGRSSAGTVSRAAGTFTLTGLDPGTYTVCVDPLDTPVAAGNLSLAYTVETDFEALVGVSVVVGAGQSVDYGDVLVDADVGLLLNGSTVGLPVRGTRGTTRAIIFLGGGLVTGTTLAASDPLITFTSPLWNNGSVWVDVTVPAGAPLGHVDLMVTDSGGNVDILSSAIEITPPDPQVTLVAPGTGSAGGGTALTITGTGFLAGARVILGENVYRDGQPGGCTVTPPNTITLTTAPTEGGTYDVVVQDATGVEGRASGAFDSILQPSLTTVFPVVGSSSGGTEVTLKGQNFLQGLIVRINGVPQPSPVVEDAETVCLTTAAGVPGLHMLQVENPGGGTASVAFAFTAQMDPSIVDVAPSAGSDSGGDVVSINGAGFTANSTVVFGADPDTGTGGTPAAAVVFVDPGTLQVTTPTHPSGATSVLVRDMGSQQAAVLTAAFTFRGSGGGGGCRVQEVGVGPPSTREVLAGAWWIVALLVLLARTHHEPARQKPQATGLAGLSAPAGTLRTPASSTT